MAVRTVDINRKAYERSWGEAAALLDERLSHPDATIGDALGVVDAWLCDAQVGADAFRVFADGREAPKGPAGGPYGQCIGTYGRYQFIPPGLVNRVLPQIILNRLPENIDTIVEFGSGLGQNHFRLETEQLGQIPAVLADLGDFLALAGGLEGLFVTSDPTPSQGQHQ